jgi:uncharacterized protein
LDIIETLRVNLLSPLVLAFVLGVIATLIKSDLELPEPVIKAISLYLLFSIGIRGGEELSRSSWDKVWLPALFALALAVLIPIWCYLILRKFGRFDVSNSAGIAAHYGSVSSATFVAALTYAQDIMRTPAEGFLPALTALMEWGIIVAIFIGRWQLSKREGGKQTSVSQLIKETLSGRSVILLMGGLIIGYMIGPQGYKGIEPVFGDLFKGVLVIFLLEMGMVAARQFREFFKVGGFMVCFGIFMPIFNGLIGVLLGTIAGLGIGGAFVFGAVAASSSYIDAPATVRATLPKANPSIYLTASLAITFPFNLILGLPLYYEFAKWLGTVI